MRKIEKILPYITVALAPMLVAAQDLTDTLQTISDILDILIPVLITLATIVFIWGIIVYITAGPSEDKKSYGKYLVMYGLIALFAIVAIWGVVRILVNTFQVSDPVPTNVGDI